MRKEYEEVDAVNEIEEEVVFGQIAVEDDVLVEEAEVIEPISFIGVVSGCEKLNVRQEASIKSNPVCVINKNDPVVIDVRESVDGWYKVYTETGVEGFCMKQYITIKE